MAGFRAARCNGCFRLHSSLGNRTLAEMGGVRALAAAVVVDGRRGPVIARSSSDTLIRSPNAASKSQR